MKSNKNIKYGSGGEHEMEDKTEGCGSEIDLRMELIGKVRRARKRINHDSGFENG